MLRSRQPSAEEDARCVSCRRKTVETDDQSNPLRRCLQGVGITYALCARCEDIARKELTDE